MDIRRLLTTFILFFILNQPVFAEDPWFTGPFFADSGKTIPAGHSDLTLTGAYTPSNSIYINNLSIVPTYTFTSTNLDWQFSYGLSDVFDVEVEGVVVKNYTRGQSTEAIGDTRIQLGYQLIKHQSYRPDVRVMVAEIIPTGRYENLKAARDGTDATGMGSYQTLLGVNFETSSQFSNQHTLKTIISIMDIYSAETSIHGISTYGGNKDVKGRIKPGNAFILDIAGELSVTQNWVAVLEGYFQYVKSSRFKGRFSPIYSDVEAQHPVVQRLHGLFPSKHNIGQQGLGNGNVDELSLAPAIEYNFSASYGLIMGTWFTTAGKNTPRFSALLLGLNAYW